MQFLSVRSLRNSTGGLWEKLSADEEIIITNNGKPTAILLGIQEEDFEEVLQDIRRARLVGMLSSLRLPSDADYRQRPTLSPTPLHHECRYFSQDLGITKLLTLKHREPPQTHRICGGSFTMQNAYITSDESTQVFEFLIS